MPARAGSIPSSASGDALPVRVTRAACSAESHSSLSIIHVRNEVEGGLLGVREALAFHPGVERDDVDPARAPLVRRSRDLARELLLAGVGRDPDDLARLYVRPEADDEVGEAAPRSA